MDVKEARKTALLTMLAEDGGPARGRQQRLSKRIGKSTAQISQWISGYRSIDEASAREIEVAAGKPARWMDGEPSQAPNPAEGISATEVQGVPQMNPKWPFRRIDPAAWSSLDAEDRGWIERMVADELEKLASKGKRRRA